MRKVIIFCIIVLLLGSCSANIDKEAIAREYHSYYDLDDTQKSELKAQGYSDEQIENFDKEDYDKLQRFFKLTDREIADARAKYPELRSVDMSEWFRMDLDKYFNEQTEKTYAPTDEQAAKLLGRDISLDMARKMLKEYHSYDNMLKQSDADLVKMKEKFEQAEKEYEEYIARMKKVKEDYIKYCK